jgi:hemolysin activation/secretion protein
MKAQALLIRGLIAATLGIGIACGGPVTFSGNSSVPTATLNKVTVTLSPGEGGLVSDLLGRRYLVGQLDAKALAPTGISALLRAISEYYQTEGILATRAVVTKPSYEASLQGKPLVVKIVEGKISKTRIVGTKEGQVISQDKRARIEAAAPIGVGQTISAKRLDGTVGLMNRFSRQQVRPVLVPEQGDLVLEYRVKQLREQVFAVTLDNYGAESIGQERLTFDFTRWNTLTPDDKFHVKALTTFGGNSNFFGADYMLPLDPIASSRLTFNLAYSNFIAEDIGLSGPLSVDFEGDSLNLGVSWERTLWSGVGQYLDGTLGLRYLNVSQDQTSIGIPEVSTGFLLPSIGLRYSRTASNSTLVFGARIEGNLSDLAGTDSGLDLSRQGRLFAEDSFVTGSLYGAYRRYLDDLITGKDGRQHELSLLASATTSFGSRLPPSFLTVAGGFPSVRGYPLGAASGDSAFLLKIDYKYHFDSVDIGGLPTDFSLGFFSDVATVNNENALAFERDDTLWSIGLGFDAVVREDFRASIGYGLALEESGDVDSGDGEFYFQTGYSF